MTFTLEERLQAAKDVCNAFGLRVVDYGQFITHIYEALLLDGNTDFRCFTTDNYKRFLLTLKMVLYPNHLVFQLMTFE